MIHSLNAPLTSLKLYDLDALHGAIERMVWRIAGVALAARNLVFLLRALSHVFLDVESDGTIRLTHRTGSVMTLRADGNVDVYAERNYHIGGKSAALINCSNRFDQDTDLRDGHA